MGEKQHVRAMSLCRRITGGGQTHWCRHAEGRPKAWIFLGLEKGKKLSVASVGEIRPAWISGKRRERSSERDIPQQQQEEAAVVEDARKNVQYGLQDSPTIHRLKEGGGKTVHELTEVATR